jgi:hypothetical protein
MEELQQLQHIPAAVRDKEIKRGHNIVYKK